MPMQMGFRWYGEGNDKISLSDIKQIPGVSTIVWALHDKMPGEVWQQEEIEKAVGQIRAAGFNADVVESVNVHDDIKIGLPTRDKYIDNYIQTIRNLLDTLGSLPPGGRRLDGAVLSKEHDPGRPQGDGRLRHVLYGEISYDLPRLGAGAHGQAGRAV